MTFKSFIPGRLGIQPSSCIMPSSECQCSGGWEKGATQTNRSVAPSTPSMFLRVSARCAKKSLGKFEFAMATARRTIPQELSDTFTGLL